MAFVSSSTIILKRLKMNMNQQLSVIEILMLILIITFALVYLYLMAFHKETLSTQPTPQVQGEIKITNIEDITKIEEQQRNDSIEKFNMLLSQTLNSSLTQFREQLISELTKQKYNVTISNNSS